MRKLCKGLYTTQNDDGTWLHFVSGPGTVILCVEVIIPGGISLSTVKECIAVAADAQEEAQHVTGHLSIENLDEVKKMDLTNVDIGTKFSDDGRFWLCVNGISLLRFREKK